MKRNAKIVSVVLVVVVLSIGVGGLVLLTSFKREATVREPADEVRVVRTEPLVAAHQTVTIHTDGFLRSARTIAVGSPIAGRVISAHQDLAGGTHVTRGQVLLRLDDRRARLAVQGARIDLLKSVSAFVTTAGLTSEERTEWNRFSTALTVGTEGSIADLPDVPLIHDERQRLVAVTSGLAAALHAVEAAMLDLADHTITAPFSGVISGEGVTVGTWVAPGVPLATLVDTARLELRLHLSSAEVLSVAVSDPVEIARPEDGERVAGRIVRIEPMVGAGSQTATVHVAVDLPVASGFTVEPEAATVSGVATSSGVDAERTATAPGSSGAAGALLANVGWLPGSFVTAAIAGRRYASAYRVPRRLVSDGRLPVFDSGALALLPVSVLTTDGDDVLLAADLPAGTEVVTTVLQRPIEGLALRREEHR